MAEVWATVATVAVTAAGVGLSAYEYASAPGAPKAPSQAAASRAAADATAAALPDQRRLEAAAQQGTSTTYHVRGKNEKQTRQFVMAPSGEGFLGQLIKKQVPYVPEDWQPGGKYYVEGAPPPDIINKTVTVHVPGHEATADFTGYGEADVQSAIAKQNAQTTLDLEKKYGPEFIQAALEQEKLADPEGTAAREKLYDLIQQQAAENPDRPVADLLDQQVGEQLAAGKNLDGISDEMLKQAVAEAQASRGQSGATADQFAEPLTTGFAGQQRLDAAQQKALGWLSSGATPEDDAYRREQQNIANLSAFANNRTPESQFQSLSGAQNGPAPFTNGQPLPTAPNVGPQAASAAISANNTYQNALMNQANPWLAGISTLLTAGSVAGNAGYKPLAQAVSNQ